MKYDILEMGATFWEDMEGIVWEVTGETIVAASSRQTEPANKTSWRILSSSASARFQSDNNWTTHSLLGFKYNTCCSCNERRRGGKDTNYLGFSEKEAEKRISKNVWLMEKLLQFHWLNFSSWRHLWNPGLSLIPLSTNCHHSNGMLLNLDNSCFVIRKQFSKR